MRGSELTAIKCALADRKWRCKNHNLNRATKICKTRYNRLRRIDAKKEINEALCDTASTEE